MLEIVICIVPFLFMLIGLFIHRMQKRNELLAEHIENMEDEIEAIKDLLDEYTLVSLDSPKEPI
ncbi:hypothetical protein BJI48_08780 [Helicobacter sp. 11S02596-1]|nr:hypothetical protein BJI48_08780 [Helicobacter sp. 11S02596-1]